MRDLYIILYALAYCFIVFGLYYLALTMGEGYNWKGGGNDAELFVIIAVGIPYIFQIDALVVLAPLLYWLYQDHKKKEINPKFLVLLGIYLLPIIILSTGLWENFINAGFSSREILYLLVVGCKILVGVFALIWGLIKIKTSGHKLNY